MNCVSGVFRAFFPGVRNPVLPFLVFWEDMARKATPQKRIFYPRRAPKSLERKAKTPRADSACADCPGFLVLGAAPAPASTFVPEPQIVPLC